MLQTTCKELAVSLYPCGRIFERHLVLRGGARNRCGRPRARRGAVPGRLRPCRRADRRARRGGATAPPGPALVLAAGDRLAGLCALAARIASRRLPAKACGALVWSFYVAGRAANAPPMSLLSGVQLEALVPDGHRLTAWPSSSSTQEAKRLTHGRLRGAYLQLPAPRGCGPAGPGTRDPSTPCAWTPASCPPA